ncbi:HNH endonuclease [Streptomyces phage phiCAM]|uniref:HNH nuclease domain-containing protein n=1 Tax=Streptomyces phage phiCAM TaxID=1239386 RepID=K4NZT9_9CAUD|nr:HNH endonuclease [Streptomyces phage phiCAM]AFV51380.1 hypothetical protein [Streptomyces phage phiCAM]
MIGQTIGQCKNETSSLDGLCSTHRDRLVRWGHVGEDIPIRNYTTRTETAEPKRLEGRTSEEKFYSRVIKTADHWWWDGGTQKHTGLGQLRLEGEVTTANRAAWRLAFGDIPEGVKIAQTCGHRLCVRLSHLEAQHSDGTPYFKDFTPAELEQVAA